MRRAHFAALLSPLLVSPLLACARTPAPAVATSAAPAPARAAAPAPASPSAVPLPQLPGKDIPAADVRQVSVFFDFDSYVLRPDAGQVLQAIATTAKRGGHRLRIEGHCDERGTPEYNLALGDGRARSTQRYLEQLGVPREKTSVVSFGSQRPKAPGHDEASWAENRRGDVMVQ
jgi:peptidoglycan-associated lipoprotein